jgi:hypothetical protein
MSLFLGLSNISLLIEEVALKSKDCEACHTPQRRNLPFLLNHEWTV